MKDKLTVVDIARMMDVSAVKPDSSEADVLAMIEVVKARRCVACFSMPSFTPLLVEHLADHEDVAIGGVVGFPSGNVTTETKVAEAVQLRRMGCDELDMVINVGLLKSGRYAAVGADVRAVREAAGDLPLKVILECHYLSDDEVRKACHLCVQAGVAFVKTGTGWTAPAATADRIRIIKEAVGDRCGVKAAGGVRSLELLVELYRLGATRFGVSAGAAVEILNQCAALPGGVVEVERHG
jgi:deoxyribose-phosphate aldolase